MKNRKRLYSIYHDRIKNNCCAEWQKDSNSFYTWYESQVKKQGGLCKYCNLPGCTDKYFGRLFRKGRRGHTLEVDRKNNEEPYSPSNCVLACYPCNNAKSDVFSYDEFVKIGRAIGKVKRQGKRGGGEL